MRDFLSDPSDRIEAKIFRFSPSCDGPKVSHLEGILSDRQIDEEWGVELDF